VLRAADRGVRVRVLVDDADTVAGDEKLATLDSHPQIEIRIFNPFAYRGHSTLVRFFEFTLHSSRLDYRMHNKLFVVDNAIALIGGRNIGDEYFQTDPKAQFGDDDVFAAGPIVKELSASFDEFWNCAFAIPSEALPGSKAAAAALASFREELVDHKEEKKTDGTGSANRRDDRRAAECLSGRLPLADCAKLVYDSPDKKRVANGMSRACHRRRYGPVCVQSELLISRRTIPGTEGMKLLTDLRKRNVVVRVLTNSLESSNVLVAHAGYMHYRRPLLENGAQLYEVRALLGNPRGSGQTAQMASYGNYALHAKLFVFDRQRVFIGSMNFDQRSMHLNTEIGLIIDSPELAQQTAARFEAVVNPENSYEVSLVQDVGKSKRLVWRTMEGSTSVVYEREPARSGWQRFQAIFTALPLDSEL
jgi:putative cardiolipin synthase